MLCQGGEGLPIMCIFNQPSFFLFRDFNAWEVANVDYLADKPLSIVS